MRDQEERKNSETTTAAATAEVGAAVPSSVMALIGAGDVPGIADVLRAHPQLQPRIVEMLHQTRGAGFVRSVLAATKPAAPAVMAASGVKASVAGKDQAFGPDPEGPEHDFTGVGDQTALWDRITQMLAGSIDAGRLPAEVANMDRVHRERLKERFADVAKVASGSVVLQVGDLIGVTTSEKIRRALAGRPPATAKQLRAHLLDVPARDLAAALDAPALDALKAAFPDPGLVLPQIAELGRDVVGNVELVRWLVTATPAPALAILMMRADDAQISRLAATLNTLGPAGWAWAVQIDPSTAIMGEHRASMFATASNQADASAALIAHGPAEWRSSKPGAAPAGASPLTKVLSARTLDIPAIIAAVHEERTFEVSDTRALTKSPQRERIIEAATFEQLVALTETMTMLPEEQLGWYLASRHATVENLRAATTSWSPGGVEYSLSAKNLRRLQDRFPSAGPADVFGTQCAGIYERALTDAPVRRWCTKGAEPRDLLRLVTQKPGAVSTMWRALVADGVKTDWVHALGTGADDAALRILALNCPDRAVGTWIRERLLGDRLDTEANSDVVEIAPLANEQSSERRLEHGVENDASADELGRRTSELSDADAARLRANPEQLATLLPVLEGKWLVRALLRVQPPLAAVLRYVQLDTPGVPAYLRTRSDQELVEALAEPAAAQRAFLRIKAPFTVLTALREPAILAAVLTRSPGALAWLLETTDARYLLSQLGHPAVAKAAGKAFGKDELALLPSSIPMAAAERAAVERIAEHMRDDGLADRLRDRAFDPEAEEETEYETEDGSDYTPQPTPAGDTSAIDKRQERIDSALEHGDLGGALDAVLARDPDPIAILAVCRAHAAGAAELVMKPGNARRLDALRKALKTSPIAVFPELPYHAYLHTPTARRWLFEQEPADVLLRELAGDFELTRLLAKSLDASDYGTHLWIKGLPTATALTAQEHRAVRKVFDLTKSSTAGRELFAVRFGAAPAESYTHGELARLWGVLERLPASHVAQGAVTQFHEFEDKSGTAGLYGSGGISIREGLLRGKETTTSFDQELQLTREQVMAAYGIDDKQLEARVKSGQFKVVDTDGGQRYELQSQTEKMLDSTVLHEVGHAVDDMLGSHTQLVYGLAGWHEFAESDIGGFANEVGGWSKVAPGDQKQIVDAWQMWMNATRGTATTGLEKFVGEDHPAMAKRYAGVGIVDLARQKKPLDLSAKPVGGKLPIANHRYSKIYTVPERTAHSAPSAYAMTAPAEYFAECYAEYYREYDGTTKTESLKGGRLASWIKAWFDQNIDKLAFNPQRK